MMDFSFFDLDVLPKEALVKKILELGFDATLLECESWKFADRVGLSSIFRFNDQGNPTDKLLKRDPTRKAGGLYMRARFSLQENREADSGESVAVKDSLEVSTFRVRLLFGEMFPSPVVPRVHDWLFRSCGEVGVTRELPGPNDFSRCQTNLSAYSGKFREQVAKGLYFMGAPVDIAFDLSEFEDESSQFKLERMLGRRDEWSPQRLHLMENV